MTDEIINALKRRAGEQGAGSDCRVGRDGRRIPEQFVFEASRILRLRQPKDVIQVHVTYLPLLANVGELKSKPAQQSVKLLNAMGIQPDFWWPEVEK